VRSGSGCDALHVAASAPVAPLLKYPSVPESFRLVWQPCDLVIAGVRGKAGTRQGRGGWTVAQGCCGSEARQLSRQCRLWVGVSRWRRPGLCLQSNLHALSKGTCEAEFLKVKTCLSSSVRARVWVRRGVWVSVTARVDATGTVMGAGGQWAGQPRPLRVAFVLCVYGSWHAPHSEATLRPQACLVCGGVVCGV